MRRMGMHPANQQFDATPGDFVGIDVQGAAINATDAGSVTIIGKGGDDSSGSQFGVRVRSSSVISGGTSVGTTVQGQGGASAGPAVRRP